MSPDKLSKNPFIFKYNKTEYDMSPMSIKLRFTRDIHYKTKEINLFGRNIIILNTKLTISYASGIKIIKGYVEPDLKMDRVGIVIKKDTAIEINYIPKLVAAYTTPFLAKSIKVEEIEQVLTDKEKLRWRLQFIDRATRMLQLMNNKLF